MPVAITQSLFRCLADANVASVLPVTDRPGAQVVRLEISPTEFVEEFQRRCNAAHPDRKVPSTSWIYEQLRYDVQQQRLKECMCVLCGEFEIAAVAHIATIGCVAALITADIASQLSITVVVLKRAGKEAINFLLYRFATHTASELPSDRACTATCREFALSDPKEVKKRTRSSSRAVLATTPTCARCAAWSSRLQQCTI